jgi:glycosyltransferase involved in cell wall biosynthesis
VKRIVSSLKSSGLKNKVVTTDFETCQNEREPGALYCRTTFAIKRNPFSLQFIKTMFSHKARLIHLHSIWFLPCLMAAILNKKARIVTTVHGAYPENADWLLRIFLIFFWPFAKYILHKSDKIIALSVSEKDKLKKIFGLKENKILVLPNGINLLPIKNSKKKKIILFTGRIIPDKNPELLIKAFALAKDKLSGYKIFFVGPCSSDYKEELKKIAFKLNVGSLVHFKGPLNQSVEKDRLQLMKYYEKAMIFVALGSWEGLPTRLLEAMQSQACCITYSAGGVNELIQDGKNGIIIDKLDKALLAEKLIKIAQNENQAKKIGKSARITVVEKYNWEQIFRKLKKVYFELI